MNGLINTASEMPDNDPNKEVVNEAIELQRSLKRNLVKDIGEKIERRNAKRWYNEGELSNKYFFNLLNRRSVDEIRELWVNGTLSTDADTINEHVVNFYKELYEKIDDVELDGDAINFFSNITQVDENDAREAGKVITMEELTATITSCKDSAPGPDGIPYSYLKCLWYEAGEVILNAWNHSLAVHELAPSHKVSRLKLIPKVGKDLKKIEN